MSEIREKLVEQIYEDCRRNDVSAAVNSSLRLARQIRDFYSIAYFIFEQEHGEQEAGRQIIRALPDLSREQVDVIFDLAKERKIRNAKMDRHIAAALGAEESSLFWCGAGKLENEIQSVNDQISGLSLPVTINPVDAAFFHKENEDLRPRLLAKRDAFVAMRERVRSACFNFASDVEIQINSSGSISSELLSGFNEASAFLRNSAPEASPAFGSFHSYAFIDSAEDRAKACTSLRRFIKRLADDISPPDENEPSRSKEKVLNRLSYYFDKHHRGVSDLAMEPKLAESMLRRVHDRACKGIHQNVSKNELRHLFIWTISIVLTVKQLHESKEI